MVDPAVKAMFDEAGQESGEQPRCLAAAILAYAQNIDKLEALTAPAMHMAARHVETGVKPEHYPMVGDALLPAIRDVLGDAAIDEVLSASGEAYWALAEIHVGKEAAKYADVAMLVRADEAHHRDVNHGYGSKLGGKPLDPGAAAPYPRTPMSSG